jgi:surfeit locus 1 family protein
VRARAWVLLALGLLLFGGFLALGTWQVERRAWKLHLIARVDRRLHAAPVAAPGPAEWARVTADRDAYRRVRARGVFDHGRAVRVQAVTELGAGSWVLTPLRTPGFTLLVNRGFVPAGQRRYAEPAGPVTVTGLLRITEPGGAFLRHNDPVTGRWYSRDVAAIARAQHLGPTAPYFIDADVRTSPASPRGGLTVVSFRNSHLTYALTWYALAVLTLVGMALLWRHERSRA